MAGRCRAADMPDVYRRHDAFISASAQEGMSNAMLEAMASGLPIVTTRCEGVDELIGDNGIVVEEPLAEAIAAAVRSLAVDPSGRARMGVAALERAAHFTWESVAEKYLEQYNRVLQGSQMESP